ncbi:hypothetical protein WN51_12245 [Melipona quadrifasciata]|uniref:Uncharacterized protein n=1 Tax=Melipona quadrifasciata TaxID=166423 RepID=A0A0N0U5N3_9HYME|nr:hypothetical protein WN51_12245 [Melipona quadrifasciata]
MVTVMAVATPVSQTRINIPVVQEYLQCTPSNLQNCYILPHRREQIQNKRELEIYLLLTKEIKHEAETSRGPNLAHAGLGMLKTSRYCKLPLSARVLYSIINIMLASGRSGHEDPPMPCIGENQEGSIRLPCWLELLICFHDYRTAHVSTKELIAFPSKIIKN